jgi:PilZ domain-containing protein
MQHSADPEPTCRKCNAAMSLKGITPCAEGYDMWSYRCSTCSETLIMVGPRTPASAAVSERRLLQRHPVVTAATIETKTGTVACMVRNVSAAGAELSLPRQMRTPGHFTLVTEGSHLPCQIVWQRENRIGLAFL